MNDLPETIDLFKCPCGHKACNSYLLKGIHSIDSRIPERQARELVRRWNFFSKQNIETLADRLLACYDWHRKMTGSTVGIRDAFIKLLAQKTGDSDDE